MPSQEDQAALQRVHEILRESYEALKTEHVTMLRDQQDLSRKREQAATALTVQQTALQMALAEKNLRIAQLQVGLSEAEHRLHAVLGSNSWRLTAPLRGLAIRGGALLRLVRNLLSSVAAVRRQGPGFLRHASRAMVSRPSAAELAPASAARPMPPTPTPGPSTGQVALDPRLWFFLGDTIDWLQAHEQLTGVGKVTVELFLAALDGEYGHRTVPCILADAAADLVSISQKKAAGHFASRIGASAISESISASDEPRLSYSPRPGDHVLFTSVIWTPFYSELFRSLSQKGIKFSVLVFDIIPIEHPDFVGVHYQRMFQDWLETVVTFAAAIFVSSDVIKNKILKWAAITGFSVRASIIPIEFGLRKIEHVAAPDEMRANPKTSKISLDSFVLSVGTIDSRKNQILLCQLWKRLVADLGDAKVPQLALVGRDDLKIAELDTEIAALVAASKIVIVQGLADAEVAGLYRACMFTAFPSLSEGYGMPVAESLQYGKLCISSDLLVIREHAGALPWYFDPADEAAAYTLTRRAIEDPEARAASELRIAELYHPRTWKSTYRTIAEAASVQSEGHALSAWASLEPYRPAAPGVPIASLPVALARSERWCTDIGPEVSILIVNRNAGRSTRDCIGHVLANTDDVQYEIVIADNGSDPEDIALLRTLGSGVRLLELGTNRFRGEASNIGAESASGRYICLLDGSAFVQLGWLRSLLDDLEHTPEAGAVSPLFLLPDGTIGEAGATVDEEGNLAGIGRGHRSTEPEFRVPRFVEYASAATLLLKREMFVAVGGFDLAYEPGEYEDVDLCFKIRASGRQILYCPAAKVVHAARSVGGLADDAHRGALGELNRDKFVARWGRYLKRRSDADLGIVRNDLGPFEATGRSGDGRAAASGRTAAVFTPFWLTPGGGERYLLTFASALTAGYAVNIVTPHPYSNLRLRSLSREFCIDISECKLMTEKEFSSTLPPDLMVTLGNQIIPPIAARASASLYICQFPFRMPADAVQNAKLLLSGYHSIIAYSEYARAHIFAELSASQLSKLPVDVVYPPVSPVGGDADQKKPIILSVGRFFTGGHDKRHDLMIRAFRALVEGSNMKAELHLAGSSLPSSEQLEYLQRLRELASGLPIVFHVNAPRAELFALYRDAAVYWHGTGLEADLHRQPEKAEHFGISIVEAMSAECVPISFNAGGPRELITHGVDGFLYQSLDELADLTRQLFKEEFSVQRRTIGRAARQRAADFSPANFIDRVRNIAALNS
jgi:glycosyltransferase involved in cell wall biosynthesis/GT2 family glycosyltransferase